MATAHCSPRARRTPKPWPKAPDIQLLLTDVVLPEMSGRALAARLSTTHPALKVLYMSGYSDDALSRHGVTGSGDRAD